MTIKEAFSPYRDGNGLMAPGPVPAGVVRGSDNGPMFTSEYYIMLKRNGQLSNSDGIEYFDLIERCIGTDGNLHRAPGDTSQDEIDDYLGVLAAYAEFNIKANFGLPFALCRFPQLVYAWLLSKGMPSIVMFPLALISAGIIAFASLGNDPISDTDARRLNWDLWQATKRKSIINNLAGMFWHWRQTKVFKTKKVMSAVAAEYYQPSGNNPYSQYWID